VKFNTNSQHNERPGADSTASSKELRESTVLFLDRSNTKMASIGGFESYVNLRHLILRQNDLNCLLGLEKCKELWHLDVNHNRVITACPQFD
jgi:hypothetical protein